MPVELSDEQYATLSRAAQFLQEAATAPSTRREFERMAKKIRPEIETTDDVAAEVAKPYIEQLTATNAKLDDFLKAQQEREENAATAAADRARDEAFARLRSEGYTEEGVGEIQKIMVARHIADPEAAAALYDRMNPAPAEPGTGSWEPQSWDYQQPIEGLDVEGLFKNEDLWADRQIHKILQEERSGR